MSKWSYSKRLNFLLSSTVFLLLPLSQSSAAPPALNLNKPVPAQIQKTKPTLAKFRAKIVSTEITVRQERSPTGNTWQWSATIANTGTMPINKSSILVKGTQVLGGSNNSCDAGGAELPANLLPGKTMTVTATFPYMLSTQLKLELVNRSRINATLLGSKNRQIVRPTAEFQAFTFSRDKKTWNAIVKNTSPYPVSFDFNVVGIHGATSHGLANRKTKLLQPDQIVRYSGKYHYYQPGDTLDAKIGYEYHPCNSQGVMASIERFTYTY
ncbi:MAG: hypothetical protein RPU64_09550 [Candidatus Sedimenticola sp. (ex Thyasira tokunagai)]